MKFWYMVTHPFEGHHVGKMLTEVDPARVDSNHVVPVQADKDTPQVPEKPDAKKPTAEQEK